MADNNIIIFTDGSYSKKKPNIGGIGVYSDLFQINKLYIKKSISKNKCSNNNTSIQHSITNQRMELLACIDGITFIINNI